MRKVALFMLLAIVFSCATTKRNNSAESSMKGEWTITDVSYYNVSGVVVKSLGQPDGQCWDGSTWKFISNNNSGSYTVDSEGCDNGSENIKWTIGADNIFTYKVVGEDVKAKHVTEGYVFDYSSINENAFTLTQNIPFEDKYIKIVYTFTKN